MRRPSPAKSAMYAKRIMLEIADHYERLAKLTEARNTEAWPRATSPEIKGS
jgi:hypothetical protein